MPLDRLIASPLIGKWGFYAPPCYKWVNNLILSYKGCPEGHYIEGATFQSKCTAIGDGCQWEWPFIAVVVKWCRSSINDSGEFYRV